jgi:uncharacterized membrane protein YdbT with pleckstrin-like domain
MSYQFQGQHSNEEVLLVTHQHPFVLVREFWKVAIVLSVVVAWWQLFGLSGVFITLWLLGLGVVGVVLWMAYYKWQRTVFLLTNQRVVLLEQRGMVSREMIECSLNSIQQVSHGVSGVLRTMLGYGTVSIQTGGSMQPILIREMPEPYDLQQAIQAAISGEVIQG